MAPILATFQTATTSSNHNTVGTDAPVDTYQDYYYYDGSLESCDIKKHIAN
jgi:hypothetical protein